MNSSLPRRRFLLSTAGALLVSTAGAAAGRQPRRFEVDLTREQWLARLGRERFAILREGGTERAGTSSLDREKRRGVYACAGCGLNLFQSSAKFDSGTGWPSFTRAMPRAILTRPDRSHGMNRTEVLCRRCGGHLGHVFPDGPKPTGLRYCMNGLALRFRPVA